MHTLLSTPLTAGSASDNYPIGINLGVIAIAIVVAILVIRFIKVDQKGYKLLFVLYVLFGIPLMLLRQYTGNMQKAIDPNGPYLGIPLAAYGFIGIFARLFADGFTWMNKNRKAMIYLALIIGFVTYIPIIFYQSTTTNVIQSLGVGVGASMIGTFQLMFNEQHGKSKQFLTVSLLSIPPLLADFIASAIQSTVSSIANATGTAAKSVDVLKYLGVIGASVTVIAFVLAFFVKENRSYLYKDNKYKKPLQSHREGIYFVWICLLGSLIAFIKGANSGSIAQLNIEVLANYKADGKMPGFINGKNDAASYEGYLSLLFSFGQLFGGLITGLFLIGRIGKMGTFTIGCGVGIVYEIAGTYVHDPYGYLGIHVLNGFSYGVVYNLVLGFILQKTFNTKKASPMGVYQSVMSIGIMSSSFFTNGLKGEPMQQNDYDSYFKVASIINGAVIGAIVIAGLLFMYTGLIEKGNYKKLGFGKKINQIKKRS